MTDSAGLVSQRLGQMGLAHTRWPVKNHMLLLCHEQSRGKILDGRDVDAGERGELKLFEGLGFFEGSLFQTLVEAGRLPTLGLVLNDQLQELAIAEIAAARLFEAHIEGFENAGEP